MNPTSEIFGWAILFATAMGPVLAVMVTRFIDERRDRLSRKKFVFRQLMSNRKMQLSTEYVSALNLIEIEFYGSRSVMSKYKELLDLYGTRVADFNEAQHTQHFAKVDDAISELLLAIGIDLGYRLEKVDLRRGAYAPQGWEWREQRQEAAQMFLADVALGKRAFPVIVLAANEDEAKQRQEIARVQSGEKALQVKILQ